MNGRLMKFLDKNGNTTPRTDTVLHATYFKIGFNIVLLLIISGWVFIYDLVAKVMQHYFFLDAKDTCETSIADVICRIHVCTVTQKETGIKMLCKASDTVATMFRSL